MLQASQNLIKFAYPINRSSGPHKNSPNFCRSPGLHDLTSGYEISLEAAASLETTSDTWMIFTIFLGKL